LFAFAYAISYTIARQRLSQLVQFPRSALLSRSQPSGRLFDVLLQTTDCVGQGVFPLA